MLPTYSKIKQIIQENSASTSSKDELFELAALYLKKHGDKLTRKKYRYNNFLDSTVKEVTNSKVISQNGEEVFDLPRNVSAPFENSFENYNGKIYMILRGNLYYSDDGIDTDRGVRKVKLLMDKDGNIYIEKIVERDIEATEKNLSADLREAILLSLENTPNFDPANPPKINLIDSSRGNTRKIRILDNFKGIDLETLLTKNKLSLEQRIDIALQCFDLVMQLHQKHYAHLDIKLLNFVAVYNNETQKYVISFIDFGAAKVIINADDEINEQDSASIEKSSSLSSEESLASVHQKMPHLSNESVSTNSLTNSSSPSEHNAHKPQQYRPLLDLKDLLIVYKKILDDKKSNQMVSDFLTIINKILCSTSLYVIGITKGKESYNAIKKEIDEEISKLQRSIHYSFPQNSSAFFGKPLEALKTVKSDEIEYTPLPIISDDIVLGKAKAALKEVYSLYANSIQNPQLDDSPTQQRHKGGKIGINKAEKLLEKASNAKNIDEFKKILHDRFNSYFYAPFGIAAANGNRPNSLIRYVLANETLVKILNLKEANLPLSNKHKLGHNNYEFWTNPYSHHSVQEDARKLKAFMAAPKRSI